jgi:hypothetical protein
MSREDVAGALSPEQEQTLATVLDAIIPPAPERGLPGAGELGLGATVQEIMASSPELVPVVTQGLAAARTHIEASPPQSAAALLEAIAASEPTMVPALVFHLYIAYYQAPAVVGALGVPPRPPHPEGYELESGDLGLLDAVRDRGPLHRPL